MNLLATLLWETSATAARPLTLFVAKITLLLALAWLAHALLGRANPRWRRLLWRAVAACAPALLILALAPPLFRWRVLPPESPAIAAPIAQNLALSSQANPPAHRAIERERPSSLAGEQRQFGDLPRASASIERAGNLDAAPSQIRAPEPSPALLRPAVAVAVSAEPASSNHANVSAGAMVNLACAICLSVWGVGIGLGIVRLLVGWRTLAAMRRRATSAPETVVATAASIAETIGCRKRFQLGVSDQVSSPCLVGCWRPLLLLVPDQLRAEKDGEIAAILAHELTHLQGNDPAWNGALLGLSTLFWWHPLAWRTRSAHADACDRVCDAVAAGYVGDVKAYGSTLARLAVASAPPRLVAVLSMARASSVRSRIEALERKLFTKGLPRVRTTLILTVAMLAIGGVGGSQLTRAIAEPNAVETAGPAPAAAKPAAAAPAIAQAPSAKGEDEPAKGEPAKAETKKPAAGAKRMFIDVVSAETGEPVAEARLEFSGRISGKRIRQTSRTNSTGKTSFSYPAPEGINFWMTCTKTGFVAVHYQWSNDQSAVEVPERLELRLATGQTIGGVVNDDSGKPIAGAKLDIHLPINWPKLANHVFTAADLTADSQGRWTWTDAPADLSEVFATVTHPDFIRGGGRPSASMDNVFTLKQGPTVTGRVLDLAGQPIVGATARAGFDRFGSDEPEAKTDAEGHFALKNCKAGKSLITVQAEGFAPQFRELRIGEELEALEFKLEPGQRIRVRFVDIAGKPIQGALLCTDTWRGYRTLELRAESDAEGRVDWRSAPPDAVLCDLLKQGFMNRRRVPLKPNDEEQLITLYPELVIEGRVTDAATGEPIRSFGIREGSQLEGGGDRIYWSRDAATPFTGGAYRFKFDEPVAGRYLQAIADGYLPAPSRKFEAHEGAQTFDFKLQRGAGPSGIVLLPDGKPAQGAEVGLATREKRAFLAGTHFDRRQNNTEVATTDAEGRFTLLPQDDLRYLLLVLHESGVAEVTRAEFEKSNHITLVPWGRVEGRVMVGSRPDANRAVSFWPHRPKDHREYVFSYQYETRTDQEGRFRFDYVMPGPGSISRVVVTRFLTGQQHAPAWQRPLEVRSNETVQVTIGGTGRPVTGLAQLDRQPDFELDWTTNEPVTIEPLDSQGQLGNREVRYLGGSDPAGRFTVPDVPAGRYRLSLPVNNPPTPNACGAGTVVGRGTLEFTVAEMAGGRSDEPLDVGAVTATLFDTLDPGEQAPDFVVEQISGQPLRLADYRGKLVLLDFWATWCGPCVAELPTLVDLAKQFADDPRLAIIGLSCDNSAEPLRPFVEKHGLNWPQACIGGTAGRVATQYTVRAIPATFLIAPDGTVLAKNLRGDELKRAVAAALRDETLFKKSTGAAPPRFPVVRFEPAAVTELAEKPALAILEDADPTGKKDQPHHDRLRLVSASGHELARIEGFDARGGIRARRKIAIDSHRGRIYVAENGAQRLSALDLAGQKLWQVSGIGFDTLAVDPKTGQVWTSGGDRLNEGETIVFDTDGNELAAYPYRAINIAYDSPSDAFWLVGYEIIKLTRQGQVIFRKPVDGWCCPTISINPQDGSAWIVECDHPDLPRSHNRLWVLETDGRVRHQIELGERGVFAADFDPATAGAWLDCYPGQLFRVSADGKLGEPLAIEAENFVVQVVDGGLWVATKGNLQRLDREGKVLTRSVSPDAVEPLGIAAF